MCYLTEDEETKLRKALYEREQRKITRRKSGNQWREEQKKKLLPDLEHLAFVDYLKPMVLLSINTGIRLEGLLSLKWNQVSFDEATIYSYEDGAGYVP